MPTDNPMTYQEVIDNYEFKVAKKMLMREYPWIKDVFMNPEEINKYNRSEEHTSELQSH